MKRVQQVVAYLFESKEGATKEVPRSEFWPDCATVVVDGTTYNAINWEAAPFWVPIEDGSEFPLDPVAEVLECGHVLPMRRWARTWYVRPGRVCKICASGATVLHDDRA